MGLGDAGTSSTTTHQRGRAHPVRRLRRGLHWNNGFGHTWQLTTPRSAAGRTIFFQTFPQLEGIRFTHAWGGAIDTCSRFSAFWGQAFGEIAYALGTPAWAWGASRFGARVIAGPLERRKTERTG